MPFKEGARIEIENQADSAIDNSYYYVDYVEMDSLLKTLDVFSRPYLNKMDRFYPVLHIDCDPGNR
ncbi:MAG: hypothetical protein DRJ29_06635 [Bacteroidetes bacterium]|nr:MAG: hypothetical protein DRI98_05740 [Bacteroidota bacterium]RLD94182.1 MAG: hypothetical protein DRJ29_06635 [Bacteroidota bacterium]